MSYTEIIEQVLRDHPEADGLFANSDVIAAQALQVCRKMRKAVPEQFKIIGFDDVRLASSAYDDSSARTGNGGNCHQSLK